MVELCSRFGRDLDKDDISFVVHEHRYLLGSISVGEAREIYYQSAFMHYMKGRRVYFEERQTLR